MTIRSGQGKANVEPGTGSVLIVDDNSDNLRVLGGMLEQAGFKVRPALSGEIALRALESNLTDLILLDIRMPGIDGYETCRRLKANERTRDIPVIFISAMQDIVDKLEAFRVGGVDYVSKPFQEEEVLARANAHIQLYRIKRSLEELVQERTHDLAQSEARYRVLFKDSPLAIFVMDSDTLQILEVNTAYTRTLGYTPDEAVGKEIGFDFAPEQRQAIQAMVRNLPAHSEAPVYTGRLKFHRRDGAVLDVEGVLQQVDYPGHRARVFMLQDVTAGRLAEERYQLVAKEHKQLETLVHYDALTGLPNRTLLLERMRQSIEQSNLTGRSLAVCCFDLDRFTQISKSLAKDTVEHVLINVAECLRGCMRGGDLLARIGMDEFVLLLHNINAREQIDQVVMAVLERIREPFVSDTDVLSLSASMGIAVYPEDDTRPDTLLRHADLALVAAKQSGRGRCQYYDPEADKLLQKRGQAIELMREALRRREFILYYQPKVDLRQGKVVGAEALIRWRHPERGLLAPGVFLPDIEGHDFMIELSDWVIDSALTQTQRWNEAGLEVAVSVNIAGQHLLQKSFVANLCRMLDAKSALVRGKFEIEVLESSALDDIATVERVIVACRNMGVGFSLDDFGTGYSSLTFLRHLSADTLKIDQTFVRGMLQVSEDRAIVVGVIGLANAFGRKVIAEGVETVEHGKRLVELGCTLAQGYGIARPMPAEDFPAWIRQWQDEMRIVQACLEVDACS